MINAVGSPQKILLLGGNSEIGLATVNEYLKKSPLEVVLAVKSKTTAESKKSATFLKNAGATKVTLLEFDALNIQSHPKVINAAWEGKDVDLAIVAFGVMHDQDKVWQDHESAVLEAQINYTAAVSVGVLLTEKMRKQEYGQIIALSSVAGEKIRKSNFLYGSTKAGFDGFYIGLGESLRNQNIKVLVVRPGQVRTKMSAGVKEAPLTIDKEKAAELIYNAALSGKELVWIPGPFRFVMSGLRHVPRGLFRKLPI